MSRRVAIAITALVQAIAMSIVSDSNDNPFVRLAAGAVVLFFVVFVYGAAIERDAERRTIDFMMKEWKP